MIAPYNLMRLTRSTKFKFVYSFSPLIMKFHQTKLRGSDFFGFFQNSGVQIWPKFLDLELLILIGLYLLLWTQSGTMAVVRQGVTRGPDGITTPREDLNKGVGTTLVRTPGRAIQYQHSYCTVHTAFTNCWYSVPIFLLYTILAYQLAVDTRHLTILDILFSLRHY